MHSPVRVSFGLRGSATESDSDSENGSWSGSELSGFSSDSDGESLCADFHSEEGLPGFKDDFVTEELTTTEKPKAPLPIPSKESWSEIDERAQKQEQQHQVHTKNKQTKPVVPKAPNRFPRGQSNRRGSNADTSDCWRSKSFPKRRQERKRTQKRRPRNDSPLKGAVVRPYTLPSGPITILRRPAADVVNDTNEGDKTQGTTTKEITNAVAGDKNPSGSSQEWKENENGSCSTPIGSKARVVTTRFGEGFVVDNPSNNRHPSSNAEMKVARNAAKMAMAGLSMRGKDGKEINSGSSDITVSPETYERAHDNRFKQPYKPRSAKKSKERPAEGGGYHDRSCRGSRSRPNVFIGRRPRVVEPRLVREDDFLLGE